MGRKRAVENRLGQRLKDGRDGLGLSQAAMAEKLSAHGFPCHATAVAKLEADERVLSADELGAYASVIGCSTDALLGRSTPDGADLEFVLGRLQASIDDAQRSIRVALRDVSDRITEAAGADDGTGTDAINAARGAHDKLDTDARLLAQAAGVIAEARAGSHGEFRVVRTTYTRKAANNAEA